MVDVTYKPMLAKIGEQKLLANKNYTFEPKVDGTRAICYVGKDLKFVNRNGVTINSRYPELAEIRKHIKGKSCVLDGEIVIYNKDGLPDFQLFQKRDRSLKPQVIEQLSKKYPATYVVFDCLEYEGQSLLKEKLEDRQMVVEKIIRDGKKIQKTFIADDGKKLWKVVKERNLEGLMAKKKGSFYYPGERSSSWFKIKNLERLDGVIIGYTSVKRPISSLGIAICKNSRLTYIGNVGTGFTEELIAELKPKLDKIKRKTPPVDYTGNDDFIWVQPKLVAEIQYLEFSPDGMMRIPSFIRLRDDKKPEKC
ncbi:non-homologous end-joining DNA ligase [Candidatus Berkelbacteria bacterium]|nr:non-homologous end-joining DNA ligase [Candidatus Berkelbacteria bacterium]